MDTKAKYDLIRKVAEDLCTVPARQCRNREEWIHKYVWEAFNRLPECNIATAMEGDIIVYRTEINEGNSRWPDLRFRCRTARVWRVLDKTVDTSEGRRAFSSCVLLREA